jgi:hypothetical protein
MGIVLKGLSQFCGINYDIASGGYRCVFSEDSVALEGVKSVSYFCKDSLLLNLKKCRMEIKGEDLYIRELYKGYISICGKIISVNLK